MLNGTGTGQNDSVRILTLLRQRASTARIVAVETQDARIRIGMRAVAEELERLIGEIERGAQPARWGSGPKLVR